MSNVTIFYDGSCPICVKEMKALHANLHDANFINVFNIERMAAYPEINTSESLRFLHVIDEEGEVRVAVDANLYLWELLGNTSFLRFFRLPFVSYFANLGYRFFARHRYFISKLLTGRSRCEQCEI